MSLKELKKYDAAQAILTQLLAIKPEYIEAISGQAHIFFLQQDYLAAINHFEKIIEIEPDYFTAWYNIACCYARQKNKHQAIASLQKAAKIDPEETAKLAKEDEDFQSLHQEPNFIKLLKAKQT